MATHVAMLKDLANRIQFPEDLLKPEFISCEGKIIVSWKVMGAFWP